VREAYGILAYRSGDYRTAVRELRTSLRITGRLDVLPMIADAERGMGRPERALDIASSDDASALGADAAIELMIVVAGAYADTGDIETALGTLEIPALRHKVDGRWQVRLWAAYSDLLARAGRQEEAKRWLTLRTATRSPPSSKSTRMTTTRPGTPVPLRALTARRGTPQRRSRSLPTPRSRRTRPESGRATLSCPAPATRARRSVRAPPS